MYIEYYKNLLLHMNKIKPVYQIMYTLHIVFYSQKIKISTKFIIPQQPHKYNFWLEKALESAVIHYHHTDQI